MMDDDGDVIVPEFWQSFLNSRPSEEEMKRSGGR